MSTKDEAVELLNDAVDKLRDGDDPALSERLAAAVRYVLDDCDELTNSRAATRQTVSTAERFERVITWALRDEPVPSIWQDQQCYADAGWRPPVDTFDCPAVVHHGPGHQSATRCEWKTPHRLEGEHGARNPMEPGFEWTGEEGYER